MAIAVRRIGLGLMVCGFLPLFPGCGGSKEVEVPAVTEESLTPDQQQSLVQERDSHVDPGQYALDQLQAEQQREAAQAAQQAQPQSN